MGGATYNAESRLERSVELNYVNTTVDNLEVAFKQKKIGEAHQSMLPKPIRLREARDSDVHPNTYPLILCLDVTGSMGRVPAKLIRDGLPHIVTNLIDAGIEDIAILFMAVGDHESDMFPLQIGQFESGDEELDLWLSRTYPEGKGGVNEGESYGLAYKFAAHCIVTDAWEKRGQKGTFVMIADEPALETYPKAVVEESLNLENPDTFTIDEALSEVKEKWHVVHINPHNDFDRSYWQPKLGGQRYIALDDVDKVPETIVEIVSSLAKMTPGTSESDIDSSSPVESRESTDDTSEERTNLL